MSRVKLLIAAFVGAVALIFLLSDNPAHATPSEDQRFYDLLASQGLVPHTGIVTDAHRICADVWTGVAPQTEVSRVWKGNPQLTWDDANNVVFDAIVVYCPPTSGSTGPTAQQEVI